MSAIGSEADGQRPSFESSGLNDCFHHLRTSSQAKLEQIEGNLAAISGSPIQLNSIQNRPRWSSLTH